MKLAKTLVPRMLNAAQRRFIRSRPGSVLILVIVLIVMLALLATAYLATARTDRAGSISHVQNTQVEQYLNGMIAAMQGKISDGLFDHSVLSPAPTVALPVTNFHFRYCDRGPWSATPMCGAYLAGDMVIAPDAHGVMTTFLCLSGTGTITAPASDATGTVWTSNFYRHFDYSGGNYSGGANSFLASRLPDLDVQTATGNVIWPQISPALTSSGFEDPTAAVAPFTGPLTRIYPTFKQTAANGPWFPAISATFGGQSGVGGDADGDGIADSLMSPIGVSDGLKWYVCVRAIDDNSAVNASTAWNNKNDPIYGSAVTPQYPYYGFFPSNVGMGDQSMFSNNAGSTTGMLDQGWSSCNGPSAQMTTLNYFRFNNVLPGWPGSAGTYTAPTLPNPIPQDDYVSNPPTARTDFQYITAGDALYHQLARRLRSPGFNLAGGAIAMSPGRYNALPESESAAMAYHFVLCNPNTYDVNGWINLYYPENHHSIIEQTLAASTYWDDGGPCFTTAPWGQDGSPIANGDVNDWYNDNFGYNYKITPAGTPTNAAATYGTLMPMRALLVASNPVSNAIPAVYSPIYPGEPISSYMLPYGSGDNYVNGGATYNHYRGQWTATVNPGYQFNDIVLQNGRTYVYVGASLSISTPDPSQMTAGFYPTGSGTFVNFGTWQLQPYSPTPVKTSVNTATFRELFRAYWSVMAGTPSNRTPMGMATSGGTYLAVAGNDPYGAAGSAYNPYYSALAYPANFDPQYMWRSSLRDPTFVAGSGQNVTRLDPLNEMQLRASIAAVNTLGLRDQTQTVISRTISLNAYFGATLTPVEARVYSSTPQPFITEVFVSNDSSKNDPVFTAGPIPTGPSPAGYVAIELFNPYPFALNLNNWQVAEIKRPGTGVYPNLAFKQIGLLNGVIIPPYQATVLENYNPAGPAGTDARFRPKASKLLPQTGALTTETSHYIQGLEGIVSDQGEFVLLRPRRADGVYTASTVDPLNLFNEGTAAAPNLVDLVPIDSFDFTGMNNVAAAAPFTFWNYNRGKSGALATNAAGNLFKSTYPGRYSVSVATPYRQEGIGATIWATGTTATYPAALGLSISGLSDLASFGVVAKPGTASSYPNSYAPIQIVNGSISATTGLINGLMPGPNAPVSWQPSLNAYQSAAQPYQFPFGGFARNGDILDVTYIGAYRIRTLTAAAGTFTEMNSLPMDCSFADAFSQYINVTIPATVNMGQYENIGRFCPLSMPIQAVNIASVLPPVVDTYGWARNLFTYLTVQAPSDDYMPNVDPGINDIVVSSNPVVVLPALPGAFKYPGPYPSPVYNADPTQTNQMSDCNVGVQGLININTAPWRVLAALPLGTGDETGSAKYGSLAQAIVAYRTANGPFTSIFDLNKVIDAAIAASASFPEGSIQNADAGWGGGTSLSNATTGDGLLVPTDPTFPNATAHTIGNGVGMDFQSQFATLTRLSNLITTRSDTFTVYVCVQGWQNANTVNATPVVTKRVAFIADRSQINALLSSRYLRTLAVPQ